MEQFLCSEKTENGFLKKLGISIFFLFFALGLKAQCPPGNLILYSQEDVNAFATNYPNCTEVSGNLAIQGANITDLTPLSNLTSVGGYLSIAYNSSLTSLNGLSNLTSVGGFLGIYSNPNLTNLDGLSNLTSVGADLVINSNYSLTDISGLENINPSTFNYLEIKDNPNLSVCNLENFCTYLAGSGLRTISGNAGDCVSVTAVTTACTTSQEPQCPTGDVTLYSQADVNNFATNYPNCTEITGYLNISGSNIADLSPLSNIQSIGGLLEISYNSQLTNLDGLSNLTEIGGYLFIYYNSQLTNLDGLSNLTQIGGYLEINSNSQLTNLDGLSNLTQIGERLYIYNNSQLTNLDGLSALESIGADLAIYSNSALTDISGLQNIDPNSILSTYFGVGLYIVGNPLLSVCNMDNFCTYLAGSGPRTISNNAGDCVSVTAVTTACTASSEPQCPTGDVGLYSQADVNNFATNYPNCTEITGYLHIGGSNITDLSPLSNIQSIGGDLYIYNNYQLTNLDGLSNLTQIGGDLSIQTNAILENLDGLSNLTEIGGFLIIYDNSLTNLDGLSALESINGDLGIYNNAVLTDISGLQNIDPATILPTNGLGLYILNNPLLSVCNLDNFCTYLAGSGARTISGNAGDCISVAAVNLACNPVCDAPNALTATATSVSATLGWTSTGDNFDIEWGVAGFTPGSGTLITDTTTNSYNLTSLSSNTQYQFYVRQDCTLNESDWVGPFSFTTLSQCPEGSVLFTSQAQVNTFATNYPNCTEISGYLYFYGNDDITDLSPLSNLTSVGGLLGFESNLSLTNLDGLSNLTSVGGFLGIYSNPNLTNISGLENITGFTELYIENNTALSVCHITSVCAFLEGTGNRTISGNATGCQDDNAILANCPITAIPCDVPENLTVSGIINNKATINWTNSGTFDLKWGAENFTEGNELGIANGVTALNYEITGLTANTAYDVYVRQNCDVNQSDWAGPFSFTTLSQCPAGDVVLNSQADVNAFGVAYPNCTQISGSLHIQGNDISNLSPLNNITQVGGYFAINYNPQLTQVNELSNLTNVGGFIAVVGNPLLTNLNGLSALTSIGGDINIQNNNLLSNISGLENINPATIQNVYGFGLYIVNNPSLSVCHLENFNAYLSISSNIRTISGNAGDCVNEVEVSMPDCPTIGLVFVSQTQIDDFPLIYPNCTNPLSVEISRPLLLDSIDIFSGFGPTITNLNGLSNITSIQGDLSISAYSLSDISGLSNLTHVGGSLRFEGSPNLSNLENFSNLTHIGGTLFIINSHLTNLNGLNNLTSVGEIDLDSNDSLTDISALENVNPENLTRLYILYNPNLSICNLSNFCIYLSNPYNSRTISGNAGDCISEAAVNLACTPNCDAPTDLTATATSISASLGWTSDGDNFDIEWGTQGFTQGSGTTVTDIATNSYNLSGLDYSTQYEFYVRQDCTLNESDWVGPFSFTTLSQCPPNDNWNTLELATQAQVDAFGINYPTCTSLHHLIIGNIFNPTDISNLEGLSNLTSLGGFLVIAKNPSLVTLNGLNNLTYVGDRLSISNNHGLLNINGLSNLGYVNDMAIASNSSLINLEGLINLTAINGQIVIDGNSVLTDISGLENIEPSTISGNLRITNNVSLSVCDLDNFCIYLSNPSNVRDISGNAGECLNAAAVNLACNPVCENPTLLSATNITTNSAELNWSASGTYYDIEWGLQGFTLGEGTIVTNLETTTHTINSLDIYTQYEFYVLSKCSNIELESEWVGPFTFMTLAPPCEAPTDLSTSNMTSDSITLNWTSSVNLFDIQYGSQGFGIGQGMSVTNISDTSYTFNDLTTNAYYDFYVRAKCTNNESEWVGPYSFMIGLACPNDDVILNSQTEVNDFIANYPSCTEILGDLIIQGNDISDLSVLSNLAGVNGDLRIQNTQLTNLHGLHNLSNLEGDLYVYQNDELISLLGSSNLTSIQGDLYINENLSLENLSGLSNIIQISGGITITNTSLVNLNDLSSLTSMGGNLLINFNSELLNLNGLNNLTTIGGYLDINNNSVLENLNGLSGLTTIEGGEFYIEANAQLANIVGLHNLNFSNIQLVFIASNSNLSVCHIDNLCIYLSGSESRIITGNAGDCQDESTLLSACGTPIVIGCPNGDIVLLSQAQIDQFIIDYPYCTEIEGNLIIGDDWDITDITDLSALSNITSIEGNLKIVNTQLTSLEGLSSLTTIGGDIQILENWELVSLFDHELVSFDGYLDIWSASMLESLSGFTNTTSLTGLSLYETSLANLNDLSILTTIGSEGLYFAYNIFTDFSGLNNLTTIDGNVYIADNHELVTFEGLNNLTSIVGQININLNTALSDISALANIDYTTIEYLEIFYNSELSECSLPSFCAYFANSGQGDIYGNIGNCMNIEDVEEACSELGGCNVTTTWNGTSWSNGEPTITTKAIIDGALILTSDLTACELEVTENGSLVIPTGRSFTVKGQVINNSSSDDFVIESNGILLQIDNVENQGAITVERESSPMYRLDYTIWSSPVSGMLLRDFSDVSISGGSGTLWNRVYTLGDNAWDQVWASQQAFESDYTSTFAKAKGYMYRAKNVWVTRNSGNPAEADLGVFIGVPNNGTISINTPFAFNAIGNPYPSPIDGDELLDAGATALYFWTNANTPDANGTYQLNNWAYYNQVGGTGVQIGGVGAQIQIPNGIIQPGQGFVVNTTEAVNQITFNNEMRMSTNGSFFRQMRNERHRFWLNLSDEMAVYNQILVGYMENATQDVDAGIDAKMFAYEGNAIYSIIDNNEEKFVIQGRSLPFTDADVVKLGFRAIESGSFSISLNNFDGIFEQENLIIYLKDNFNQTQHNLKNGAYSFVSEEGMFENRFEVVYQTTMSTETPISTDANWIVYKLENGFQVQTVGFEMKEVSVYDMLGRVVYTSQAQGQSHHIPALGVEGVFIVKVTTTEDKVLNKKVR